MDVDITSGNITVSLSGVASYCGTMVQADSPDGVKIMGYSYGTAGTGYQVINPTPVGDATAITSTVDEGTWLLPLDSLVCLFVRSPRPSGVTSNNDDAMAIVVVPYAVDPSEAATRIRPSAIGDPSNPTIAAHRATEFLFNTTAANNIPSVIDVDALPTTWGTFANNRPVVTDYQARFALFCGELWTSWGVASQLPSQQHPLYGRTMASLVSEALLLVVSTDNAAQRKTLAFRMTQWGVDLYGAYVSGRNDQVDGGHYQGRLALVVLAGHMLGVSAMLNAITTFPGQFCEPEQFYEASPAWVWGWPYGYKGRTEFPTNIADPIASWSSNPTIFYLTGYFEHFCGVQLGTSLAMRILNRVDKMGAAQDGMMAQWMEGPTAPNLAAMATRDASLASISWGTSYSAYDATEFAQAAWETYAADFPEAPSGGGDGGPPPSATFPVASLTPTMRVANLTPFPFTGWARGTTDAGLVDPGTALVGDGCKVVRGLRTGLETQAVDVLVTLAPWEERTISAETPSALAYPFPPPADPLSHFGGPLTCNGQPMDVRSFQANGAAWTTHCTARVGELFHVDVWLRWYPGEAHAVGECMVTASKAGSPALTDICPGIWLGFGDGIVQGVGLPVGAPIVPAGEQFGDGQARVVPFSVLWVRNVTDASQWTSYQAAKDGGIVVRGCTRSFHDGNVSFPAGFDARAWAAQHWGRAVALLHSWDSPALGPAADSGQTGAQEDQCFTGVESLLPDGAGAQLVNYLAALKFANRPCHHLEDDGSVVDAMRRPSLRMFYSRPHRSGSDMLGKPRDLLLTETRGWNGPDAQHWFFSRQAMAARFTGSPACQRLLEHQARNYLIQLTTTPGAATSAIWSARELGWEGIAVVHLWRELADRGLADRVMEHWHRRANWLASKLPITGPLDIRVNDDRLGTGPWWMAYQQALAAYGLDLGCRVMGDGGSHLLLIAANAAKLVVDSAYDGTTEYELLALDGRRSRSGYFATAWMPLAVAMRAREDVRAAALLAHIKQQAGGDGRWIPPTS